jgi:PKD repeat protein
VEQDISSVDLTGVYFDDLQADRSLHYAYPAPPAIIVTSPSKDVEWMAGEQEIVKWESYGNISKVDILYSVDGGNSWTTLLSDIDNTGSVEITIPNVTGYKCLIKVKDRASSAYNECSAFFTINNSAITSSFTYQITQCSSVVSFTNTSSSSAVTYLWSFGDGITSTERSPEHNYSSPGNYTVKLTVSDGSNSNTKSESITVSFAEEPVNVKAEAQGDGTVKLSAEASGTINWYDVSTGGTPLAAGNDVTITSSATIFYAENVTDGGACTSKRVKADLTTEVKEKKENEISIYPNPARDYIKISELPSVNCMVMLYGSNVQQMRVLQSDGSNSVIINTNGLTPGIYFCKVLLADNVQTVRKVIIIK